MDAHGGHQRQLTTRPSFRPSWSAGATRIAFMCSNALCVIDPRGGHQPNQRKLTPPSTTIAYGGRSAWSPDGRFIVFGDDIAGGIYVVPVRGGKPRTFDVGGISPTWQRLPRGDHVTTDVGVRIRGSNARLCGSSFAYARVVERGTTCAKARQVTTDWARERNGCGFADGHVCHVDGFACVAPPRADQQNIDVYCSRSRHRARITGHVRPH